VASRALELNCGLAQSYTGSLALLQVFDFCSEFRTEPRRYLNRIITQSALKKVKQLEPCSALLLCCQRNFEWTPTRYCASAALCLLNCSS
jgi:hypothetical protein